MIKLRGSKTISFLLILLITVLCLSGCGKNDPEMDAWVYAKHEVELQLKAPKTAEFCTYTQAEIKDRGNNQYTITGYVDAENSFGAMLRTDFTVKLTLTKDGYKDAKCYFGDDSLFAIAEDVAEEHGYTNSSNSSGNNSSSSSGPHVTLDDSDHKLGEIHKRTSERDAIKNANLDVENIPDSVMGPDLKEQIKYLQMTIQELAEIGVNKWENVTYTPINESSFLGKENVSVYLIHPTDAKSSSYPYHLKLKGVGMSIEEAKAFLEAELVQEAYDVSATGSFTIDIPGTDLKISAYDSTGVEYHISIKKDE